MAHFVTVTGTAINLDQVTHITYEPAAVGTGSPAGGASECVIFFANGTDLTIVGAEEVLKLLSVFSKQT